MYKKGQIHTMDLYVSVTVFLILIVTFVLLWNNLSRRLDTKVSYEDMSEKAIKITDLLVEYRGLPDIWENEPNEVQVIGLVSNDRVLSNNKVSAFINNISYSTAKSIFNVRSYDFYFRIINSNNVLLNVSGKNVELGLKPSLNSSQAITVSRIVSNGGSEDVLQFTLWK